MVRFEKSTANKEFLIISSTQKTLQPPLKKSKGYATDSPLETINKPSSHDRRHRLFAAGKAKGFEEGTECGRAQGLTEGIKEATQSAAREVESLRATNNDLQKRLSETLEQSNGVATENLLATQTAAGFVVELQRERNLVAALERTVADQTSELANLKRINEDQACELAVLRSSSASFLGLSSSTSATRPASAYFKR